MGTRMQLAQGFSIIGTVGLLVAAFVVPSQWQSGQIRLEGQIGVLLSLLCLALAAAAARSITFALKTFLSTLLMVSLGYLAMIPFVVPPTNWNTRASVLAVSLSAVAVASAFGLWRLRRSTQQSVQFDCREDAAPR
jgi:hypothetical protein